MAEPALEPDRAPSSSMSIPAGAWDSHMHVVDADRFPLSADAVYRPAAHSAFEALAFEASLGIQNLVLVQPSIYGHDNACMLEALGAVGGPRRARAVVSFDPDAPPPPETLRAWHALGVRGVRINIQSVGLAVDEARLGAQLRRYADIVRPLGWAIQVYVPLALVASLEPIVPELNVRFCIDHIGHPPIKDCDDPGAPYTMPGFAALARLVESRLAYVKLSAPYRLGGRADYSDIEPVARELLRLGGHHGVVFATDWPHTRFEGLDIRPWVETVLGWCGSDAKLVDRVFRDNAMDLWGVESS